MVAAGGDSSAGLFEPEEFRDGEHLPAAGTASSVADAAGEQLAVWAAAFGGEALAAAGAVVDPGGGAGSAGRQRGQRCRRGSGGGPAIAVGRLAARGATEASGPAGAQRGAAALRPVPTLLWLRVPPGGLPRSPGRLPTHRGTAARAAAPHFPHLHRGLRMSRLRPTSRRRTPLPRLSAVRPPHRRRRKLYRLRGGAHRHGTTRARIDPLFCPTPPLPSSPRGASAPVIYTADWTRPSPVQTPERLRLAAGDTFGSAGPGRPGTPRSAPAAAPPAWRSPEQERPGRRVHRGRQRERQQQAGRVETPKPAASNSISSRAKRATTPPTLGRVLS